MYADLATVKKIAVIDARKAQHNHDLGSWRRNCQKPYALSLDSGSSWLFVGAVCSRGKREKNVAPGKAPF